MKKVDVLVTVPSFWIGFASYGHHTQTVGFTA